jgi:uncharacterized protein (TIGR03437 family)
MPAILLMLAAGAAHASGPVFSATIGGSGQDFALAMTSDAQGNTYVAGLAYSPDFPVTPQAFQTKFGQTCDAFVTKLGPDGKVIWSTYLGGILDDWATGVAVDSAGNVLVAGYTRSANFPLANPIESMYNTGAPNNDEYDAFVAKLDPSGSKLLYSTFLGGIGVDGADGIAVDAAGNAYVAVTGNAAGFPGITNGPNQGGIIVSKLDPKGQLIYSFFHPHGSSAAIALDAAGNVYVAGTANPGTSGINQVYSTPGNGQALVFKLSADGTKKLWETALGGSVRADASAIAVDKTGAVYVGGTTSSVDFPLVNPLQGTLGARPLWRSSDSGTTWKPLDDLPFALPQMLVADPAAPNTLYQATGDLGVFKSLDGGATWRKAGAGIAGTNIRALAIDPVHPQTLYAAATGDTFTGGTTGIYKTVDGANQWTLVDTAPMQPYQLVVDARNTNILYQVANTVRKTTDGGVTWNALTFPGTVRTLALDPHVSGSIVAVSNPVFCGVFCGSSQPAYLYRSTDGGANWAKISSTVPPIGPPGFGLTVDASTNPATLYDGLGFRSDDFGITWTAITPPPGVDTSSSLLVVDGTGTLYTSGSSGIFLSRDHAQTWTLAGTFTHPPANGVFGPGVSALFAAGATGTLFGTLSQVSTGGFVTKLSPDGATIVYSTYLRGHPSLDGFRFFAAEPGILATQTWISAIAVDGSGNATVAGGTRAADFPVAMPAQAANAGLADAFAATLSADGSQLNYATYFGGSDDDGALAAALDSQGNVILAGQTWSFDFPVPGGIPDPHGYSEAFVVKLAAPGPPSITSVVNGASLLPGIEAGSWVTVKGTNLANTFPGRTWRDEEVVNGNLPTSLDGVSVTIDGKAAFVYYLSPTQINVQAPSDSATGAVNVVVTNNSIASAPATAQLQAAAPAFFLFPGTNYALASRLPDYALVGPAAISGTIAAKPGDLIVLWGTGFGATNPPVPAGVAVTGSPAVAATPTVTVGNTAVPVISAALTAGTAGLYQVTIQLPATVPAGVVAVQASVGGATTQAGVTLFVGQP